MKTALDDGGLGAPLLMHCAHRNPSVPDYGFTTDMIISDSSVHEIDIVRWLFGEEIVAASVLTPRRSGHAFGLPHPLGCDQGTCSAEAFFSLMFFGYTVYPDTYFLDEDKVRLEASSFFAERKIRRRTDCRGEPLN